MKGNINLISYDCYQQATEKQLAGLKWKENRVYYISEIHNEKMQDEIYGYIDDRCRRLSLSTVVNDIYRFDLLKEFLNEKCTSCSSITDKKWEELERSYKAFLYKKGLNHKFCGISDSSRSSVGSYRIASERNIRHQDIRIPVCEES